MTIAPPPCSTIAATAARVARRAAKKFSCSDHSKSSSRVLEEAVEAQLHAADVVDEHVDAPVALDRLAHEPLGPVRLDEVDRDRR